MAKVAEAKKVLALDAIADEGLKFLLEESFRLRQEALALEEQAKAKIQEANALAVPTLEALGVDRVEYPTGHAYSVYTPVSSATDQKAFRLYLVTKGVSPALVAEADAHSKVVRAGDPTGRFDNPKKGKGD